MNGTTEFAGDDLPVIVTIGGGSTAPEWTWLVASNSTYPTLELTRRRAGDANLAANDIVGQFYFVGRAGGADRNLGRIDTIYTGDGTTQFGEMRFFILDSGSAKDILKLTGNTIQLSWLSGPGLCYLDSNEKMGVSLGTSGQIAVWNASSIPVAVTMSKDATINAAGEVTIATATGGTDEAQTTTDLIGTAQANVGTWQDTQATTGSIGSTGTYDVSADVRYQMRLSAGIGYIEARLYNVTDGVAVTNSERMVCRIAIADTDYRESTVPLAMRRLSLTAGKEYRLEARTINASGATFTSGAIVSNTAGRTILAWTKLAG